MLVFVALLSVVAVEATDRPIIGVFAQPHHNSSSEYIAASYIKWIEAGGGRAVPIPFKSTDTAALEKTFNSINGLLYPGGAGFTLSSGAKQMYDMAIAANKRTPGYAKSPHRF